MFNLIKEVLKWVDIKVKSQAIRALAAARLRSDMITPVSIIAYWGVNQWFFFSSFGPQALTYNTLQDSYNLAFYYYSCATIPALSILIIFTLCKISCKIMSRLQSFTCGIMAFLAIENVIMGLDAIINLDDSPVLYAIDEFIQGDPSWWLPIGASDILLVGILMTCLISYVLPSDSV